jgi:hypothetical protein
MEHYTSKFDYPGVIKQGDSTIGKLLVARARLVRAKEQYKEALQDESRNK